MKEMLARVRRAALRAAQASHDRDEAILIAHEAGATIRAIAAEAGLSPARVHQILHGR